jgi:hypothetical protein
MMSYRFKRRSFLRGVGGAAGLKIMLNNLEAKAQGAAPTQRMLVTHWPVGYVKFAFVPTAAAPFGSPCLQPFANANLQNQTSVLLGLSTAQIASNGGGGHEAGTVKLMTGVDCPGTRGGEPEQDDAFAGGPSFDQIMLSNVPSLKAPGGQGYANSICDARVDFLEVSTQCLSYDYQTRPVSTPSGSGTENIPLTPTLSPLTQWMNLFSGIMPNPGTGGTGGGMTGAGGSSGNANAAMLRALQERKSVLDYSLAELAQIRAMAPSTEASKIDLHTSAIRNVEMQLQTQIASLQGGGSGGSSGGSGTGGTGGGGTPTVCTAPAKPSATDTGQTYGTASHNDYGNPMKGTDESAEHSKVAHLHMDILRTAFICDLLRMGTFQFSPGTNHVSFGNQFPNSTAVYMHHPESHKIGTSDTQTAAPGTTNGDIAQFLANVHTWYNTLMAALITDWKNSTDGMGNNLLDYTVIPYLTEVQATGHEQNNMAGLIFGGSKMGFQHGQFVNSSQIINNLWLTVAQPFGVTKASLAASSSSYDKAFANRATGPIAGLWTKPA